MLWVDRSGAPWRYLFRRWQESIKCRSPLDETGLNHVDIRDDASLYMTSYGAESISTVTGEMMISSTDLSLPGLIPFDLTRIYDSARVSGQLGVQYDETTQTYSNVVTPRKEELHTGLGQGWRWDIPYMETRGDERFILIPGVGYYRLNANLELEGYVWNDLTVKQDTTVTVDGQSSSYCLSIRNGYDYLFNGTGELLQITDGYRNTVDFHYTTLDGNQVISRIQNSEGQALTFAYDNLKVTVQLAGTDRKVTYTQREDEGIRILREFTDALDRTTTYTYYYPESKFNFLPELESNQNAHGVMHTALLSRITNPSSAITDYAYIPAIKEMGEASSYFVFKVRDRKSRFSTTDGEGTLDKTTKVNAVHTVNTWAFSKTFSAATEPDLVYADQHTLTGDDVTYSTELQYDSQTKRNLPTQTTEWVSKGESSREKLITTSTYDANGILTSEKLSTGQESTYVYETGKPPYNWVKPVRSTTKINSMLERYTETMYNNQGSILKSTTKNGYGGQVLSDSELKLDDKGRVISKTDKGRYLAKERVEILAYDSSLGNLVKTKSLTVHDSAGKAAALVESYSYTPAGDLDTITNAAGEQETYQYDKSGRLLQITYADGTHSTTVYEDTKNLIQSTSPDGIKTTEWYNPMGLLVEEQTGDAIYKYAYDYEGNITATEDAEGNVTKFVNNAFGQVIETQYPDGTTELTMFDPDSLMRTLLATRLGKSKTFWDGP